MKVLLVILATMMFSCQPSKVDITEGDADSTLAQDQSPITWTECGYEPGDHPCDFELMNQDGDMVTLYELYGKPIVIDFSTMWCYYCQVSAVEVGQTAIAYETEELVYITILVQNFQGETPSQTDLEEWATHFVIGTTNTPVLSSSMAIIDPAGVSGWKVEAWPTFYFIDKEMVITEQIRGWSSVMVQANIEQIVQ